MQNKAKKFSRKLLALTMAIVTFLTCFSGALSAFAANSDQTKYYDENLEYNSLAWNVLSDEQLATAVLDYADEMLPALKALEPKINKMVDGKSVSVLKISHDLNSRKLTVKALGITLATVTLKLGSVDELIETINSVQGVLSGGLLDTAKNVNVDLGAIFDLDLSALGGKKTHGNETRPEMRRYNTSSCDIIRGVLGLIYDNNDTILGRVLRGEFSLGVVDGSFNVYKVLGDLVGLSPDKVKENPAYNMVQSLLFNYTEWFTPEEIAAYNDGTKQFVFDEVLLDKMTTELLTQISVKVTYDSATNDNSATRYDKIKEVMVADGIDYAAAATKLGYDPNIVYSDQYTSSVGNYRNVLLFAYGNPDKNGLATAQTDSIRLTNSDSLYAFGKEALRLAWSTVIKDSIKLLHANNNVDRGHGSNFDNAFYNWMSQNAGWNKTDIAANYSTENVNAWAAAVCKDYGTEDPAEFLGWVQNNYTFSRTKVLNAKGTWEDIDATSLFNKVRYSPLADYAFDMQTGPINLYFAQTGTANIDNFFDNEFKNYDSLIAALNDALVAAVKDVFPNRANIYVNEKGDTPFPAMTLTGNITTVNSASIKTITESIMGNTLDMIQYVANTTDQNILGGFKGGELTEANLEEAMIPMLIACIGRVKLNGNGNLASLIHKEDWNACKDAEAVAYLALKEYLSYVIPNKDYSTLVSKDADGKYIATLEGTIMPMARDAIIYVIEPYVPVTDKNGNAYKVETGKNVDATTDLFDLFNSVVCYYADFYKFSNSNRSGETAFAGAAFFGLCEINGNEIVSTVNRNNDLWTNFDIIANRIFPLFGELQGNGKAKFDSKSLIMGDIVNGFLEISEKHTDTNKYGVAGTGLCGVSNLIYRILTMVSADPIQKTPVTLTAYDIMADTLNALAGPRYPGQEYVPIPTRTSSNPFDDLMQKTTLAGTGYNNVGVVQKAINNFIEFAGFGWAGPKTYKDSIIPGLAFAVSSVNSFFNFLPFIGEHNLKLATANTRDSVIEGCNDRDIKSTQISIKNNAVGLNTAYINGRTGNVQQMSRYYLQITNVAIDGAGAKTIGNVPSTLIAPGKTVDIDITTQYIPDDNQTTAYSVTFTYNICLADGTPVHEGLKVNTYQYLTGQKTWLESVYKSDDLKDQDGYKGYWLQTEINDTNGNKTASANGYTVRTTPNFSKQNYLTVCYPTEIVLSSTNAGLVNNLGVRAKNISNGTFGMDRSVDGIYYYDTQPIINTADGSTFTPGVNNAIPVFDKATGDILNLEKFDISLDGGKTRIEKGFWGYDAADTRLAEMNREGIDTSNALILTNVAYTFDEIKNSGALAAYHINEIGQFENMYLQNASGDFNYDKLLGAISFRGPIDGFYLNTGKITVPKGASRYMNILKYDGETQVPYTDVTANVCFYNSSSSGTAQFRFIVCDDSKAGNVQDNINEVQQIMANYRDTDFNNGTATYDYVQQAITKALASKAMPLTPNNAPKLSDQTEFTYVTADSWSPTGDNAYTPLTRADFENLTPAVKAMIFYKDGKYYFDAAHTQPVYSTVPLTSGSVSDSMGIPIEVVTDDSGVETYKVTNAPKMATEWVTTGKLYETYPCQIATGEQATDGNGAPMYNQIQWSYYNADGRKVSSNSTWVIKVPEMSNQMIAPTLDTDTRGIYTQCADLLSYATNEVVYKDIKPGMANDLYEKVSSVRNNLNEKNFDIVTYNKMVAMAKDIESRYRVEVSYVDSYGTAYDQSLSYVEYARLLNKNVTFTKEPVITSLLSSTQVKEFVNMFNTYMGNVVERGYIGDQLEAEIFCASGNTYDVLAATPAVYSDTTGELVTPANIARASGASDPKFGEWDANGNLVNDGTWSNASWNVYVEKLANAVDKATIGNDSAYPANNSIYDPTFDYAASVTQVYNADSALQVAENALTRYETVQVTVADVPGATVTVNGTAVTGSVSYEVGTTIQIEATANTGYTLQYMLVNGEKEFRNPYSAELRSGMTEVTIVPVVEKDKTAGVNVSASLVAAKNTKGATDNNGVNGNYTVTIKDGETVVATNTFALTSTANTFTFEAIPAGTYTMEITSDYALTRDNITLVVGDTDVAGTAIPVVVCDYNKDTFITAADVAFVYKNLASDAPSCDLNGDTLITTADASFVYSCMGATTLPAITVK